MMNAERSGFGKGASVGLGSIGYIRYSGGEYGL